jgi:hypothetical protein
MRILLAYATAFRSRPLRTVLLTILCFALFTFATAAWLALATSRREQHERAVQDEHSRIEAARLALIKTWKPLLIPALDGATAELSTTCQGYPSVFFGTFRYRLTFTHAAAIKRLMDAGFFPRVTFHIQFLDHYGFKQREIDVEASQLMQVMSDSPKTISFQANDAAGACGSEILDYASWNLSYPVPNSRPRF